jgi:putative spermidine/putrescine transport system permease protein
LHLRTNLILFGLLAPAVAAFAAFFILPLARLALASASGPMGFAIYWAAVATPRYAEALGYTLLLSTGVTAVTLAVSGVAGVFLTRNDFRGKSLLVSMLTFPLAFPGVVVGFMIILLSGRQGLVGDITQAVSGAKAVFAYSMGGLFLGYLYFSIPRVITTVMAAAENKGKQRDDGEKLTYVFQKASYRPCRKKPESKRPARCTISAPAISKRAQGGRRDEFS